jgi:hypothetical protein
MSENLQKKLVQIAHLPRTLIFAGILLSMADGIRLSMDVPPLTASQGLLGIAALLLFTYLVDFIAAPLLAYWLGATDSPAVPPLLAQWRLTSRQCVGSDDVRQENK